jgi:integrase
MKSRKALQITSFCLEQRKDKKIIEKIKLSKPHLKPDELKKLIKDTVPKEKENVPILVDFKFDGQRAKYPIGYRIDFDKWNAQEQLVKRNNFNKNNDSASTINKRINDINEWLPKIYNEAVKLDIPITAKYLWDGLTKKIEKIDNLKDNSKGKDKHKTVTDYIQLFIDTESKAKDWSENTKKKLNTLKAHVSGYGRELYFKDITEDFLQSYITYQRNDLKLFNTTNLKYLSLFKWFMNWATKKEYNTNLSYKKFEYKFKGTSTGDFQKNIIFLSWEELQHLNNLDLSKSKHWERVRDIYCFCSFTSLRYSDVANLKKSDFKADDTGNTYIEIITVKTDDKLTIELNKYALAIWEKYKDIDLKNNKAFPVISNQKYNEYLKEVGKEAGFKNKETITKYKGNKRTEETFEKWELLTTHTARKNFIINALYLGIQPDIIRAWTGHKDHKTMEVYTKIVNKQKRISMNKFNEI